MARSLTISHEEKLAISPLFIGFMLLAITCMMLSAVNTGAEPIPPEAPPSVLIP